MNGPHVHAEVIATRMAHTLPGRAGAEDIASLADSLGHDGADPAAFLRDGLCVDEPDAFVSALFEQLLMRPPIPAGCAALLRAMAQGEQPWRDHEVPEDRVGLWTAHAVAHAVAPDRFPAPTLTVVTLALHPATPLPDSAWRRPRARTLLAAAAMAARPGAAPVPPSDSAAPAAGHWAFDALWHVDAHESSPTSGALTLELHAPPGVLEELTPGARWSFATA